MLLISILFLLWPLKFSKIFHLIIIWSLLLTSNNLFHFFLNDPFFLFNSFFNWSWEASFCELFIYFLFLIILFFPTFSQIQIGLYVLELSILGIVLLLFTNNWISFYIILECQSLIFYLLASSPFSSNFNSFNNISSGIKYFIVGSFSSILILIGITLIYNEINILSINIPINLFKNIDLSFANNLIILGILMKLGIPPFHQWNIEIISNTKNDLSLFFSTISKISLLFILVKFFYYQIFSSYILYIPILFSWFIGTFFGLIQNKIKRLLAYSGLIHLGFLLLSLTDFTIFIFYLTQYFISLTIIFLLLHIFKHSFILNTDKYKYFNNWSIFILIINLLSLAGYPPFLGFFGKLFVFFSFINPFSYLLAIFGMLFSVFSFFIYFNWISIITINNKQSNIQIFNIEQKFSLWIIILLSYLPLFSLLFFLI